MADTLKRMAGPSLLTTSAVTKYTVPVGTTATITEIHVCNESAGAVTLTLSIGTDAAGKRLFKDTSIPANSVITRTGTTVMEAGEVLQALAGTGSALTLTVSGVETT